MLKSLLKVTQLIRENLNLNPRYCMHRKGTQSSLAQGQPLTWNDRPSHQSCSPASPAPIQPSTQPAAPPTLPPDARHSSLVTLHLCTCYSFPVEHPRTTMPTLSCLTLFFQPNSCSSFRIQHRSPCSKNPLKGQVSSQDPLRSEIAVSKKGKVQTMTLKEAPIINAQGHPGFLRL